jgi:rhodanese-related sulfurtransferase
MNNLFENYGIFSGDLLHLSPKETFELCQKGAVIVDVREDFMIGYKKFEVPSVLYFPLSEINTNFNKLPIDKYMIFADADGLRSKEAVILLIEKGLINIANMAGGLV